MTTSTVGAQRGASPTIKPVDLEILDLLKIFTFKKHPIGKVQGEERRIASEKNV